MSDTALKTAISGSIFALPDACFVIRMAFPEVAPENWTVA